MIKSFVTLTIIVLLAVGGYCYFIYRNSSSAENISVAGFLAKLNFPKGEEISKKSEAVGLVAQDFKTKTGNLFEGLSKTFSATMGKVSSTVSLVDDEFKNNKLVKLVSVFDGSGQLAATSTPSVIPEVVGVCINFNLNQPVSYSIENPFQLRVSTSTYYVDWGDGGVDKNVFTTTTAEVSHVYSDSGEFVAKFKVENGEAYAEVSKKVCIK